MSFPRLIIQPVASAPNEGERCGLVCQTCAAASDHESPRTDARPRRPAVRLGRGTDSVEFCRKRRGTSGFEARNRLPGWAVANTLFACLVCKTVLSSLMAESKPNGSGSDSEPVRALEAALADPAMTRLYANGFTLGITNADAYLVLQLMGKPVATVSMSYTLAKTLSERLGKLVADWEAKTGQKLATTDIIDQAFRKESEAPTP